MTISKSQTGTYCSLFSRLSVKQPHLFPLPARRELRNWPLVKSRLQTPCDLPAYPKTIVKRRPSIASAITNTAWESRIDRRRHFLPSQFDPERPAKS